MCADGNQEKLDALQADATVEVWACEGFATRADAACSSISTNFADTRCSLPVPTKPLPAAA